ncbi:hypothetical protein CkaCkLH20_09526 [Colletotrichum karsti]|uniref:Very-long-chain 3-oxoacyl-CoA reductase n=1 Tax=Colletotrichum karsti TaxID=1095194 RepID=A0A9P6LHA8_9PEZI|nr:uncharacterized protein CkaCkLH20_09526 [Colletotrichum karsti]KAF9873016.1 hypothetical protein CkaCkLH20_09526 [Colletotrichum karsti]
MLASTLLRLLGAATLAKVSFKAVSWLSFWLLPELPLTKYRRSPQPWAMITGASAGIGLGFAEALAARNFNIVLLGHKQDELEEAKIGIVGKFPRIGVRIFVLDAISASPAEIQSTLESLSHLNMTILVNNVGGLSVPPSKYYRRVNDTTAEEMDRVISLNARFMAHLTRLAIPILARNGPSLILNVGSASMLGMPGVATYSACKSFVMAFTKAVGREMRADGIQVDVLALVLGEVYTQANAGKLPPGTPTAKDFAEAAVSHMGRAVSWGRLCFHPWMWHALQDAMVDFLPESVRNYVLASVFHQKRKEQTGLKSE